MHAAKDQSVHNGAAIPGLAVQSYCFRAFKDNRKVASLVKACGLSAIEICAVHADFNDPAAFTRVVRVYADEGVEVVSIGVNRITADSDANRRLFECAAAAGLGVMSIDFDIAAVPDVFSAAESLADEYQVNLAIHNHGGRHWLGSAQALRWVFSKTGPRIGLNLDTAWALDARENPVALAKEFAGRLRVVHLKDFVFDRSGKPEDVIVGSGNLDLAALDAVLVDSRFHGASVLEYEGDENDPVPALRTCVEALGKTMRSLPAAGRVAGSGA